MKTVSVEEFVNHKILPYDLYNEKGKKLFSRGELLTPGKILQLKYISSLFIKEEKDIDFENESSDIEDFQVDDGFYEEDVDFEIPDPKKRAIISPDVQQGFVDKFKNVMESFIAEDVKDTQLCLELRDEILEKTLPVVNKVLYKSQLRIYGDPYYTHSINVALLSAMLAHKMKLNENAIKDVILAAILHDIGKTMIPRSLFEKAMPTSSEQKLIELHSMLGYKIIKNELGLSSEIANVALQHHERCDGFGYPYGLSAENISTYSHIIMVCNYYDNLTAGKGPVRVKNAKEAIKLLLSSGARFFRSDVLYTFIHMTNYNDLTPLTTINKF